MAKGMFPALSVAFFTKSSAAALPMAIRCAEENVGISRRVASFTLPLCTTINMNACAAFILITVLFVSMSQGYHLYIPGNGLVDYSFDDCCDWQCRRPYGVLFFGECFSGGDECSTCIF